MTGPYARRLGVVDATVDRGVARLRLPYDARNSNRNRTLHGGVSASLLALVSEAAADRPLVTLSVTYLTAAVGIDVRAEGRVVADHGVTAHVAGRVEGADHELIATALATVGRPWDRHPARPTTPRPEDAPDESIRPAMSPYSAALGLIVVHRPSGSAVARLPYDPALADGRDTVAPGAIATMIDTACGASTWSLVGFDPAGRAATLAMHLAFHRAPRHEALVAQAQTIAVTDAVFTSTVTVWGRSDAPVATGTVVYHLRRGAARA